MWTFLSGEVLWLGAGDKVEGGEKPSTDLTEVCLASSGGWLVRNGN